MAHSPIVYFYPTISDVMMARWVELDSNVCSLDKNGYVKGKGCFSQKVL